MTHTEYHSQNEWPKQHSAHGFYLNCLVVQRTNFLICIEVAFTTVIVIVAMAVIIFAIIIIKDGNNTNIVGNISHQERKKVLTIL